MIFYSMPVILKELAVMAPAKVNLHLAVKDKRPDRYHNLESVFLAVDWGDRLFFEIIDTGENSVSEDKITMFRPEWAAEKEKISLNDNTIFRALSLFREKTGFLSKFKITAEKRIPIGGGLGGGSSDAAAALLALNKIAGFPLDKNVLLEMGAAIGSDVPFFLHETAAAYVTGRGECIEPLKLPPMFLSLVNPGFPRNTAKAFGLLDKYRESETKNEELEFNRTILNSSLIISNSSFFNSFLPVFGGKEKSIYNEIISDLMELGAEFAGLSGAGSTCFGIFHEWEQAIKATEVLQEKWGFGQACKFLG